MASTIERTFGARLRKAQDLLNHISGFENYAPPRTEESVDGFRTFIDSVSETNNEESRTMEQYRASAASRQYLFKGSGISIKSLLTGIRGAVESQYGRRSAEVASIVSIIKKMRTVKLVRIPANAETNTPERTISRSELSYGSITAHFAELVETLGQFNNYSPSNPALQIGALLTTATKLTQLNDAAAQHSGELKETRIERNQLYGEMKDRISRIKAYVRAQYGSKSKEYQVVRSVKV